MSGDLHAPHEREIRMTRPSPDQIADIILNRRLVFDPDTDSRIREAANRLTARALFELFSRLDGGSPDFASHLSGLPRGLPEEGASYVVGFDTDDLPTEDDRPDAPEPPAEPSEHYLRLVFRDEQAAYYQFHLFPDLDADYVCGASRKRAGAVQHLRIELSRPEALAAFIESCRSNPHFVRAENSTADEFHRAPSNGV
jgi:hypothetical protein